MKRLFVLLFVLPWVLLAGCIQYETVTIENQTGHRLDTIVVYDAETNEWLFTQDLDLETGQSQTFKLSPDLNRLKITLRDDRGKTLTFEDVSLGETIVATPEDYEKRGAKHYSYFN